MKKQDIFKVLQMTISDLITEGFSVDELVELGKMSQTYYSPSDTYEYFDGESFYNENGQQLRDPSEYDSSSEGYTPFGDE